MFGFYNANKTQHDKDYIQVESIPEIEQEVKPKVEPKAKKC